MSIPAGLRGLLLVAFSRPPCRRQRHRVNGNHAFLTRTSTSGYIRPRAGTKELIYASYGFGALVMLIGFAAAYSTRNINDIWGWLTMGSSAGR